MATIYLGLLNRYCSLTIYCLINIVTAFRIVVLVINQLH